MHHQSIQQTNFQYPHFNQILKMVAQEPQFEAPPIHDESSLTITYSNDGGRVRKVVKRSNARMTYKFRSIKNMRAIQCESHIELMGMHIIECCPHVVTYLEQPASIAFTLDGVQHSHVPDVLVEFAGGKMCFIEFKPESEINDLEFIRRTEVLSLLLPGKGYQYLVIVPSQMMGIAFENAKILLRIGSQQVKPEQREYVRRLLWSQPGFPLGELVEYLPKKKEDRWIIYALILSGDIQYDWLLPITSETRIYWVGGR